MDNSKQDSLISRVEKAIQQSQQAIQTYLTLKQQKKSMPSFAQAAAAKARPINNAANNNNISNTQNNNNNNNNNNSNIAKKQYVNPSGQNKTPIRTGYAAAAASKGSNNSNTK